jgi:hypothetical protein
MTRFDAYEDEMRGLPRMSVPEIEALLNAKLLDGDDLAGFVCDVRDTYLGPPDDATAVRHLAAMKEATHVLDSAPAREARSNGTPRGRWAFGWRGAMTRMRTAALAAKLAAVTLVAALATGGLAAAGVISLPELPGAASDQAKSVHEAIEKGGDPTQERCAFGLQIAQAATDGQGDVPSAQEACEKANAKSEARGQRGKGTSARRNGDVGVQQNGAQPDPNKLRSFGDSVSDRATGGEPKQGGRAFGESVSGDAQELVPHPTPQTGAGPQTGESHSQQGQQTGESHSQQGQQTGESFSQDGRETGDNASGGRVP